MVLSHTGVISFQTSAKRFLWWWGGGTQHILSKAKMQEQNALLNDTLHVPAQTLILLIPILLLAFEVNPYCYVVVIIRYRFGK